ncbi:MAG: TetR/AcrR family transcriptional regulator [Pseudomonadota bacterium]
MAVVDPKLATNRAAPSIRAQRKAGNRQKLIEATIDSIAELGLAGTTVSTVIERAGLSRGIINLHFDTKEALLIEVMSTLAEGYFEPWNEILRDPNRSPAQKLVDLQLIQVDPVVTESNRIKAILCYYGDPHYIEIYKQQFGGADLDSLNRIAEVCGELIRDGGYKGIEKMAAAISIWSVGEGIQPSRNSYPKVFSREACRAALMLSLNRLFPRHIGPKGEILTSGA